MIDDSSIGLSIEPSDHWNNIDSLDHLSMHRIMGIDPLIQAGTVQCSDQRPDDPMMVQDPNAPMIQSILKSSFIDPQMITVSETVQAWRSAPR
jgi:hypothetical protein